MEQCTGTTINIPVRKVNMLSRVRLIASTTRVFLGKGISHATWLFHVVLDSDVYK